MTDAYTKSQRISNHLITRLIHSLYIWEKPLSAAILAGLIYLGISATAGAPWRVTDRAYFNYLADAFLHGQLHLRVTFPTAESDLSLFNGKYYLYWGPLPAIFAMPLVAVFGVQASDVLQSIFFGALDAGLFAILLQQANRRKFIETTPIQRSFLVLFFTLGSSLTPLPAVGKVWYLSTIEMLCFALLAYIAAVSFDNRKAFFWTGCFVSGVLLTRMSAIFIAIFLAWYLLRRHWQQGWRKLLAYATIGLLPVIITLGIIFVYNLARFGNGLETGTRLQLMGQGFIYKYSHYGLFNSIYFGENVYYTYLYYPLYSLFTGGWIAAWGGSIFLLGPLFFAAITALFFDRKNPDVWFLLISYALGNIPILFLMSPNFQFGSRYSLDFTLPLMLLTAIGVKYWRNRLVAAAVCISILHYLAGALIFVHFHL